MEWKIQKRLVLWMRHSGLAKEMKEMSMRNMASSLSSSNGHSRCMPPMIEAVWQWVTTIATSAIQRRLLSVVRSTCRMKMKSARQANSVILTMRAIASGIGPLPQSVQAKELARLG